MYKGIFFVCVYLELNKLSKQENNITLAYYFSGPSVIYKMSCLTSLWIHLLSIIRYLCCKQYIFIYIYLYRGLNKYILLLYACNTYNLMLINFHLNIHINYDIIL